MMARSVTFLVGLLTFLYPLAVYFGTQRFSPRVLSILLCFLLIVRLAMAGRYLNQPLILLGLAYAAFAALANNIITLRYYPVMMNAALLLIFGFSLLQSTSFVERLARLQTPDLPPQGVLYTRRVTVVWCVFFLLNGGIALTTALYATLEVWSLFNGLISYILIGLLFAGEFLFRQRMFPSGISV